MVKLVLCIFGVIKFQTALSANGEMSRYIIWCDLLNNFKLVPNIVNNQPHIFDDSSSCLRA